MSKEHKEQLEIRVVAGGMSPPLCRYCQDPMVEGIVIHLGVATHHICSDCMLKAFDRSMSVPGRYNEIC